MVTLDDSTSERRGVAGSAERFLRQDLLLLAALALLGGFSIFHGYDVYQFVTGDTLYPVQMIEHGILEFRPPPPNRVLPDVLLHWLVQPLVAEPLAQKLVVGIAIFAVMMLLVGLFKGLLAFALFFAIMVSNGFDFLVTASHYSLPLSVLLFQAVQRRRFEAPVLFAAVFSNPLVLLPLALPLVEPASRHRHIGRTAVIGAAMVLNTLYSEFSETLLDMLVVFPIWYIGTWIGVRLGFGKLLIVAGALLLPIGSLAGLLPARYAVAVAASMLLLLFPMRRPSFDWRFVAVPAAAMLIFAATADWRRYDKLQAGYDCVIGELARRGISVLAVDHWTARPLHYAARRNSQQLTITQTDFADNRVHSWMAAYDFYGEPTVWGLRSGDACRNITTEATYCGQASVAEVAEHWPICGGFELYRYETPVPAEHPGRPESKLESIRWNLGNYVEEAFARFGLSG